MCEKNIFLLTPVTTYNTKVCKTQKNYAIQLLLLLLFLKLVKPLFKVHQHPSYFFNNDDVLCKYNCIVVVILIYTHHLQIPMSTKFCGRERERERERVFNTILFGIKMFQNFRTFFLLLGTEQYICRSVIFICQRTFLN